ncbi:MAG: oligopeptide/dipeptide ABC transporter ATP-binding protein [Pseudomonadota bacterium]
MRKVFSLSPGLFGRGGRMLAAVDDVSIEIAHGEAFGLVGESGSGKSTLAQMVAGLHGLSGGRIVFGAKSIEPGAREGDVRTYRRGLQMIFQDPFSSLNPRKSVGDLIGEAPRVHRIVDRKALETYVRDLMERCGIDADAMDRFPHQFSGGQRQRIGIARALGVRPEILVCDEAVSALDVSIQAQILNLFMDLRDEFGLTYVFISHDLGVIEHLADRVVVMYLGRIVESGPTEAVFDAPAHPYTRALIEGVPRLDRRKVVYSPIKGDIPSPFDPPSGCAFHPRCPLAFDRCATERPPLVESAPGRMSACHLNSTTPPEETAPWPPTKTG